MKKNNNRILVKIKLTTPSQIQKLLIIHLRNNKKTKNKKNYIQKVNKDHKVKENKYKYLLKLHKKKFLKRIWWSSISRWRKKGKFIKKIQIILEGLSTEMADMINKVSKKILLLGEKPQEIIILIWLIMIQ